MFSRKHRQTGPPAGPTAETSGAGPARSADGFTVVNPLELYVARRTQQSKPRQLIPVMRRALRLVWAADRKTLAVSAIAQFIGAIVVLLAILLVQVVLQELIALSEGHGSTSGLVVMVVGLALATSVAQASVSVRAIQQRLLGDATRELAMREVMEVTTQVGLERFDSPEFAERVQRVEKTAVTEPLQLTNGVIGIFSGLTGVIALVGALAVLEPWLLPPLLLASIPALYLARVASRAEFHFTVESFPVRRRRDYLTMLLMDRDAAKEIRAFGSADALLSRQREHADRYLDVLRSHTRRMQWLSLGTVLVNALVLAVTLVLLAWFIDSGRMEVAAAGAAAVAVRMLSQRMGMLTDGAALVLRSQLFLDDLADFLTLTDAVDVESSAPAGPVDPHPTRIQANELTYRYPTQDRPAISNLDLTLEPGTIVALVGENGSGKTTLAKLLAGLYRPENGAVCWNGTDLRQIPASVRSRSAAVLFQDFVRYPLSAAENIGLGDPDHLDNAAAIEAAARTAGIHEHLVQFPQGYATLLTAEFTGGRELSVGQWQRVALARALLRKAPLVILDEPSAALDPKAEYALYSDVRRLFPKATIVLITHRYTTVRDADRILVLSGGSIVEDGAHEELLAHNGLYAELYSVQARAYT